MTVRRRQQNRDCTFCKTECDKVIFFELDQERRFEEWRIEEELPFSDTRVRPRSFPFFPLPPPSLPLSLRRARAES